MARLKEKIDEVAKEIPDTYKVPTLAIQCDITDTDKVNAICPGYFYTPLTKETLDSDFFQQNEKTMIPEER